MTKISNTNANNIIFGIAHKNDNSTQLNPFYQNLDTLYKVETQKNIIQSVI